MIQIARRNSRRETRLGGRARTGKIARLPRDIRDQLNRRLQDGEKGKTLLVWLNAHEKVQRTLKTDFDGRGITKQNLSDWLHGGYREWLFQQEAIEVVRRMDIDVAELDKASKTSLIDLLSRRLAAQYLVMLANGLNGKGAVDLKLLNELCGNVVALRRSDQAAERLRVERDRLDLEREELHKARDGELFEWAWKRRMDVMSYLKTRTDHQSELYRLAAGDGIGGKTGENDELSGARTDESDPVQPSRA
jgi:hypothetical protein